MPLAKPSKGEDRDTFISRCSSDEKMIAEFPNKQQRIAVCYVQWRERK